MSANADRLSIGSAKICKREQLIWLHKLLVDFAEDLPQK